VRILVTSGGTREAIDDVRYIGNSSTGATGRLICEEALRRYHTVHWLRGVGSAGASEWMSSVGLLQSEEFSSAADLLARVRGRLSEYRYDAVVHSAAVADYTVERSSGKVSSGLGEWNLRLVSAPKVVDQMVPLLRGAWLVVFKLESLEDEGELLERARALLRRTGAGVVVANRCEGMGRGDHGAMVATLDQVLYRVTSRSELAGALLEVLEKRCQKN